MDALAIVSETERRDAARIKMLLPYGDKLTDANALALVAYSRLHGLDPFNGECFFLVKIDKEGKRTELGLHPGIKGLRKKAKEQIQKQDSQAFYRTSYDMITPATIGLDPEKVAIVVKVTLRDSISEGRWIANAFKLSQVGYSKDEVEKLIGSCPVWIGYGMIKKEELWYLKQAPIQMARKRAEADATRQRFDLPFADEIAEEIAPGQGIDYVEAEFTPTAQLPPTNGGLKRSEVDQLRELGFDIEEEPQPEPTPIQHPTPEAWDAWDKLVEQADDYNLAVPDLNPETITLEELRNAYREVDKRIKLYVKAGGGASISTLGGAG